MTGIVALCSVLQTDSVASRNSRSRQWPIATQTCTKSSSSHTTSDEFFSVHNPSRSPSERVASGGEQSGAIAVTALVTAYNHAGFVEHAIESALAQEVGDGYEIL